MAYTIKDASGDTIYIDGAGTGADAGNAITPNSTILGAVNEAAPATDTASSGLNGRLQRIAQRLTSLIALLPASIGQKAKTGSLSVTLASDQDALPITDNAGSITVDGTVSVTGVATAANQSTGNASLASLETKIGEVQANPTSNTVLDRLKAIATALAGTLTVATHAVTQSGTWTVQPGNTANTTAWKVDGSAVTQPVSGTVTAAASENHVGEVATAGKLAQVALTVSTSPAYTAGDSIGGKITIANAVRVSGGISVLSSLQILDRANQKPAGTIYIFNADPSAATLTDNSAFVFSTDDLKVVAQIPVSTSDYVTTNSKATANLSGLARIVGPTSGTSLWAAFVTTSTPTFAATTDVQLGFGFANIN